MRKFAVFNATLFSSILLAGLYGILHDQITYTIAPEYFTKFKFDQFGFEAAWFGGDRWTVAAIGFLATWWTGIFIGLGIGLTGLIFKDHISMRKAIQKAMLIIFCIALCMGIIGFFYGKFILTKTGVNWWLPENLISKNNFIIVGSIHYFSYLGGLLGLLVGIFYLIRLNRIQRNNSEAI
jgi:predicted secreted protein